MSDCLSKIKALAKELDPENKFLTESVVNEAYQKVLGVQDQVKAMGDVTGTFEKRFQEYFEKRKLMRIKDQVQRQENILKRNKLVTDVKNPYFKNKPGTALLAVFEGGAPEVGYDVGMMQKMRSWSQRAIGNIVTDLEKIGSLEPLIKREMERNTIINIDNLEKGLPLIGNEMEKESAKILSKVPRLIERGYDDAKVPIGRVPSWILPQSHDPLKIAKDPTRWVSKMYKLLDHEASFPKNVKTELEKIEWLKKRAGDHINGTHTRAEGVTLNEFDSNISDQLITVNNKRVVGKEAKSGRVYHFKDGEALAEYHEDYGKGSLIDTLITKLHREARNIELSKVFGSGVPESFEATIAQLKSSLKKEGNVSGLQNLEANEPTIRVAFKRAVGLAEHPAHDMAIKFNEGVRSVTSWSKLFLTGARTYMLDHWSAAHSIKDATGQNIIQAYASVIREFIDLWPKETRKDAANKLGIHLHDILYDAYSRFNDGDFMSPAGVSDKSLIQKGNELFYKYSGIRGQEERFKAIPAKAIARFYAENASKSFEQLNPQVQYKLKAFDISPKEWDLLKLSREKFADGTEGITPEALKNVSRDQFLEIFGETKGRNFSSTISDLSNKIGALYQLHSDLTVAAPLPRYQRQLGTLWGLAPVGIEAHTWQAQLIKTVMQFKNAAMTQHDLFRRTAMDAGEHNRVGARNAAAFVIGATLLKYGAESALNYAQGKPIDDPLDIKTGAKAFVGSGAFGYWESLIGGAQYGDMGSNLVGPSLGHVFKAAQGPKYLDKHHPVQSYISNIGTQAKGFLPASRLTIAGKPVWDAILADHIKGVLYPDLAEKDYIRELHKQNR